MPATSDNTSATGGYLAPLAPVPGLAAPLDDLALDTALAAIVAGLTGLPGDLCRPRWQGGDPASCSVAPRIPDVGETWCAVGVMTTTPDDRPAQIHRAADGGSTLLRTFYMLDVLATFYGPRSDAYAKLTRDSLYVAQCREAMRAQGLNLLSVDPIRRLPEITATQTRRRSDLAFRLTQVVERVYAIRNVSSLAGQLLAQGGKDTGPSVLTDPLRTDPPAGA